MSKTLKLSVIAIIAILLLLICGNTVNAASHIVQIKFNNETGASGSISCKIGDSEMGNFSADSGYLNYDDTKNIELTITPDQGCYLKSLKKKVLSSGMETEMIKNVNNNILSESINHSNTYTAIFAKNPVITINTIDVTDDNSKTTEEVVVPYDTYVSSKVLSAPEGYSLLEVKINEKVSEIRDIANFGKLTENKKVDVYIAKNPTISITVKDTEGNTVSSESTVIDYKADFEKTVTIPENYKLIDEGSNEISLSAVTEDDDIVIDVIELHEVTTAIIAGEGNITEGYTVEHGDSFNLILLPKAGYMLKEVTVNGTPVEVEESVLNIILGYVVEDITEDINIEVSFKKIPFILYVEEVNGAEIDPTGATTVFYGDNQEINIKANRGYNLVSVTVNGEEQILPLEGDKVVLKNIKENTVVKVKVEKITYSVVEGEKQKVDGTEDLVVRFSGDLEDFVKLYINGKEVDKENYTLESGSTIVTLKKEYIASLDNGKYTVKAEYSNGNTAETEFTVAKKDETPKTGDVATIVMIVLAISGLGLAITSRKRK